MRNVNIGIKNWRIYEVEIKNKVKNYVFIFM